MTAKQVMKRLKSEGWYEVRHSDLPGCVSTGETLEELQHNIREAIQLHLEGLPIPEPTTKADRVSVAA